MSSDDDTRFQVRPGRIRSKGAGKTGSFLSRMRATVRRSGNARPFRNLAKSGSQKPGGAGSADPRRGGRSGVRKGRGATFVRARHISGWNHQNPGSRRVIVKSRMIRTPGRDGRARAHLNYIQRDGTSRAGERGQLYGAGTDRADGDAFLERGQEDRHQFRFIVSPEDADQMPDLTAFTRDLMAQMETDFGTKLDWVAVNHLNTGHPHVHIVINGRDDQGEDLVINSDYITQGVRERATELVTLELGPETAPEQRRKLETMVEQDRFTRIDRQLLALAEDGPIDMRGEQGGDHVLRLRRLTKLERMGLASQTEPGVWQLAPQTETTLRELGERGDIIRAMNRAMREQGRAPDPGLFVFHGPASRDTVEGRLLDRHLSDELGETIGLVIDGLDGRTHHVTGIDPAALEGVRTGSTVAVGPEVVGPRPADREIMAVAGQGGVYRADVHLSSAQAMPRIPGGDADAYVASHVRRLEALRRAGIAERIEDGVWQIPGDYLERAVAYDISRARQLSVTVLSNVDLEAQVTADGATWLDRGLVSRGQNDVVDAGFGRDVITARHQRQEVLLERGDAWHDRDGQVRYRKGLLATLERRELELAGQEMAAGRGMTFRTLAEGETMRGTLREKVRLASGTYALVENAQEFVLVPWKPVIDRRIGQEIGGVMRAGAMDWQLERARGIGL
jgi:type IV secretory pathway VirD2 relaxase